MYNKYENYSVCTNCGTMVHKTMSECMVCGQKIKKPFYEQGVFWVCFVLFLGSIITVLFNSLAMLTLLRLVKHII